MDGMKYDRALDYFLDLSIICFIESQKTAQGNIVFFYSHKSTKSSKSSQLRRLG